MTTRGASASPTLTIVLSTAVFAFGACAQAQGGAAATSPTSRSASLTMAELASVHMSGVRVYEVSDYVFGHFEGDFPSPPHADLNPRRAYVVCWKAFSYRFVFSHEASYCPFFELPSGSGLCYQFFEGNDGWAELFNDQGRREKNSFVDVLERGPERVWVRWTYFGVNMNTGQPAYRGTEDFYAYPSGLVLRRQSYESLMPGDHRSYAREPIEMIGMCPAGRLWKDVLETDSTSRRRHALCVLDAFTRNRYDLYWTPKPSTLLESVPQRTGAPWQQLDDAKGVALVVPMRDGSPFCIFGDASGFGHDFTRLKEHTFIDTGGMGWGSASWDHWPIGWLNSQAHPVDAESLKKYPNHFSPMGMDFFAISDQATAGKACYSLIGVGGHDMEKIRDLARDWLKDGLSDPASPERTQELPPAQ